MGTPFSVRCGACNHPPRYHHRDSCDGRYLHPLQFAYSPCRCSNPMGIHKRHRRRSAWRDITVSATTVEALGMNSLIVTLVLAMVWLLDAF